MGAVAARRKPLYCIVNLQREFPSKSNWYSARLLCKKYGTALSDIEDDAEYEFLAELIRSNYRNERQTEHTGYFVDLHRYLYDTQEWSWGGPPNSQRSFVVNLPNIMPLDYCDHQIQLDAWTDCWAEGNVLWR